MRPISLNAAWSSLPRATVFPGSPCPLIIGATQSAWMLLNLRPPHTLDHLPFHMTPVVVMKSYLVLETANKGLAVLSQDCRRGNHKSLQHLMPKMPDFWEESPCSKVLPSTPRFAVEGWKVFGGIRKKILHHFPQPAFSSWQLYQPCLLCSGSCLD